MKKIATIVIFVCASATVNAEILFNNKYISSAQQQLVLDTLRSFGGKWNPDTITKRIKFTIGTSSIEASAQSTPGATAANIQLPKSFYAGSVSEIGSHNGQYCGPNGSGPYNYTYNRVLAHEVGHIVLEVGHGSATDKVITEVNKLPGTGSKRSTEYKDNRCF